MFTTAIGLLALAAFPLIMRSRRWHNVWLAGVALSVVVIACVFFWAEYSGWVKFYSDREFRTRASHTSLLWENLTIWLTPEILPRFDFVLTMLVAFWAGIVVGVISDMMFVIVTRRTLQWAAALDSFVRMVLVIVSNGLLAVVLSLGPAILTHQATLPLETQGRFARDYTVAPWSIDLVAAGVPAGWIHSVPF